MLDSNLNSLLNFRFELNPGNKRSIESYKNLYSFIHPQKKKKKNPCLFVHSSETMGSSLDSGPQVKSKLLVPFPQCQLWGQKPWAEDSWSPLSWPYIGRVTIK